jgi:hypothetical protein
MCFEGSGLMQLHGNSHSREQPTVMAMTTHPTPIQREDVFDYALHWLHRLPTLLAQLAVYGQIQDLDHPLAGLGLVAIFARCGQQRHLALPLKLSKLTFPLCIHGQDARGLQAKPP